MDYVNLGSSGLKVSRICMGMMSYGSSEWRPYTLNEQDARPFIQYAVEAGINFYDTADMYSVGVSEEITGRALKDFAKRDEVVIATKVYNPLKEGPNSRGLSRKYIMEAIDNSLRRLGTDYVDLYQIHRWDYTTPIEETMEALHDVVKAGKARYLGASSMWAWQFAKAQFIAEKNGWTRFISMQNHYNLVYREEEREMNPLCVDQGVGIIPWSPIARGFLTGNRNKEGTGETLRAKEDSYARHLYFKSGDFEIVDRVLEVAKRLDAAPAQIALAWLWQQPGVVAPIVGASKLSHMEQAVKALDVELSAEDCAYLEEPYQPHPVVGHS